MKPNPQIKKEAVFRDKVSKDSEKFQPESGRYHLYISLACPFAHRALIGLTMKGLKDHIGISIAHPTWQRTKPDVDSHEGWVFRDPNDEPVVPISGHGKISCEGCIPDTVNNCKTLREIYELTGETCTRYSTPVLWDKKLKTIVNNESPEVLRIMNSGFNDFASNPDLDLYPEDLRSKIDEVNGWVGPHINMGVYKTGNAQTQEEYEANFDDLFKHLDKVEEILSTSRYICGLRFTEADIRLFTTLLRFDEVYFVYFKCNKKRMIDYPNILNYLRELYQIKEINETCNLDHAKKHYYTSHHHMNPYSIIPKGSDFIEELKKPHNRDSIKFN